MIDLEAPKVHTYGMKFGSSNLVDNSVTPNKMRYDAVFQNGVDFGILGLDDVSSDVWQAKDFDGGTL